MICFSVTYKQNILRFDSVFQANQSFAFDTIKHVYRSSRLATINKLYNLKSESNLNRTDTELNQGLEFKW